jgi:ubiquinone/menaquinone biosynthesis C-methylase UbiE
VCVAPAQGSEGVADEWVSLVRGGDAAFEWHAPAFLELLPPPGRLTVDVGCGEGRLTRMLRERGDRVVAVDAAPTLVRLARETDPDGDYRVAEATALPLGDVEADLVVAFMSLQDVDDAESAIREAACVLEARGRFCAALVHPAASAGELEGGDLDPKLVIRGSYLDARRDLRPLGSVTVPQFHRPLEWYSRALEDAVFLLETLREQATRRRSPGRIPLFLHLRAVKR